jgi:DNA-binding LacI/PurR family transcriptional regulator
VKAATRERVLGAMEALGFEPNMNARGLRGARTGLVGVSLPHLEAMVLAQKSQVLHRELRAAGLRGIFEMPEGDPEMEAEVVRHFLAIQVDAVVLIGTRLAADSGVLAAARERGVRVVAVDPVERLEVATVNLTRQWVMGRIVEHLHGLGHRRMALLGVRTDDLYGIKREHGLRSGAKRCGLDARDCFEWLDAAGYSLQDYGYGMHLGEQLLALGAAGPRALICLNDRIAIGAMRALQDAGRRVPEDYSIVGFDNLPESGWSHPALTTVDHDVASMMKRALELLMEDGERQVRVRPRLILRDSTAQCPEI